MSNKKALTIGSLTIDIMVVIADSDIEKVSMSNATTAYLMLEQGRKVDVDDISTQVGGGAANVAVSIARQGLDVDLFAARGVDHNGNEIAKTLQSQAIGLDHVLVTKEADTGTSVLISSHDNNAAIFTKRGANGYLDLEHLNKVNLADYDIVYISPLSNNSADIFPELVKRAKDANCFVAANPGIRQLTKKAEPFLASAKNLDLLALNFAEAKTILPCLPRPQKSNLTFEGADRHTQRMENCIEFGGLNISFADSLAALSNMGPKKLLITDGNLGAYYFDGETLIFCPAIKSKPKGTAGAGDAFISTFVASINNGYTPEQSLHRATTNAASVVSHVDTQTGLLTASDLEQQAREIKTLEWKLKN